MKPKPVATPENRLALQRQTLPRDVPGAVRRGVLLGGALAQIGWIIFGFGMIFFWAFAMNADVASILHFRGELETAKGTIIGSRQTMFSQGGSEDERGTPIHANDYWFLSADEVEYRGTSYAKGRALKPGQAVTVEHPRGRPDMSRIKGMRRSPFSGWLVLVALLPAVGLWLTIAGMRFGSRRRWLLANGRLTWGALKSKEPTGTLVNDRPVYKLTFEFQANGKTWPAVARTHNVESLLDEAEERILYDPRDPARATMVDNLPMKVELDDRGRIIHHGRAGWALIAPFLAIVGHGVYVYFAWFRPA